MAQNFKETAHLKTDLKKYGEEYDRIFGKKFRVEGQGPCHVCDERKPLNGFDVCQECVTKADKNS